MSSCKVKKIISNNNKKQNNNLWPLQNKVINYPYPGGKILNKRYFTTSNNKILNKESFCQDEKISEAVLTISNILSSSDILKDKKILYNKLSNLSGVYMLKNKINNKKYIGSSVNLKRRLSDYLSESYLKRASSMMITKALLKHGIDNFEFHILEFCTKDELIIKELFYFELYSPEYNISKIPGRPDRGLGWKHSSITIEKMREAANIRNNKQDYIEKLYNSKSNNIKITSTDLLTDKVLTFNSINSAARFYKIDRDIIYDNLYLNKSKPYLNRYKFTIHSKPIISSNIIQKNSMSIQVTDIHTNITHTFFSQGQAARFLGIRQCTISKYLSDNIIEPLNNRYIIKKNYLNNNWLS